MGRLVPAALSFVLVLLSTTSARADDLDDVIDYLVKVRQTERLEAEKAKDEGREAVKTPDGILPARGEDVPLLVPILLIDGGKEKPAEERKTAS